MEALTATLAARGRGGRWAASSVAPVFIGALILGGPYVRDLESRVGPFAGASLTLESFQGSPELPASEVLRAYHQIAAEPGDEPVVEALVGKTAIHALRPTMALARLHERPVILVSDRPWRSDPRLDFHTVLPSDPRAIAGSHGRFVVLQLDAPRLRRLDQALDRGGPLPGPTSPHHKALVRARAFGGLLRRAWGEPHLVSQDALVWDLVRIPEADHASGAAPAADPGRGLLGSPAVMRLPRLRAGAWFWVSLGAAFAVGAALRLYRLGAQVLLGDELHAVRAVLSTPLPEILVAYRLTDYCLPLAGLARLVLVRTGTLSELDFRWPVVAAGLLLLAAAPVAVRRVSSPGAALVYPWLLALSPGLVLYSRIARSYVPATLLACAAAAAFFAWWRTGRRRWAAAYALLGALAVWFSLVVAPFVVSALGFGVLAKLFGRRWRDGPAWLGLTGVGLALAAGLACFVVPGWDSLRQVLAAKPGGGDLRLSAALSAGRLLAGSTAPILAGAFWLLAALGLWRLARRNPGLALFGTVLAAGQAAALAVLPPYGLGNPVILARYLLVVLPVVLFWIAHGLAAPDRWLRAARRPRLVRLAAGAGAALFLGLLAATGPLVHPRFRHSSFVHHDDFLAFDRPLPRLPVEEVPASYRSLPPASGVREDAIVELPTYPEGDDRAVHRYQDLHRRPVVVSTPTPELNDRRLAFRHRVPPQPRPILESGARYLVVHRDIEAEELAVELAPGLPRLWTPRQEQLSERFRTVAAATIERLTNAWGPPDLQDAKVVVWDLGRVRAGAPQPAPRAKTRSDLGNHHRNASATPALTTDGVWAELPLRDPFGIEVELLR